MDIDIDIAGPIERLLRTVVLLRPLLRVQRSFFRISFHFRVTVKRGAKMSQRSRDAALLSTRWRTCANVPRSRERERSSTCTASQSAISRVPRRAVATRPPTHDRRPTLRRHGKLNSFIPFTFFLYNFHFDSTGLSTTLLSFSSSRITVGPFK